jgi:hypothetical protein
VVLALQVCEEDEGGYGEVGVVGLVGDRVYVRIVVTVYVVLALQVCEDEEAGYGEVGFVGLVGEELGVQVEM